MTDVAARRFNVRLRDQGAQGSRVLTEASHEAACVAFAEEWAPHPETGAHVAVIVREIMEAEVCQLAGAELGERAPDRQVAQRDGYREQRAWLSRINAYLNENISGIAVVQLFNRERENLRRFD